MRLIVGENPPNPLLIDIVVEGTVPPNLEVTAVMARPISPVGISSGEAISVSASTAVETVLEAPAE